MAHEQEQGQGGIALPSLVISPGDVLRLKRELEALNDYLYQANLRQGGEAQVKLPKTSRPMDEFAAANKLNLLEDETRAAAMRTLDAIYARAPVVHMSFAVEPSSAFRQKLVIWWRQHIHPAVLLEVGLQPTIAIGTVLRTPSKQYDFSLRERFKAKKSVLMELIEAGKSA
jgi:hypothetical protein